MSDQTPERPREEIDLEELEGEELPKREVMSIVDLGEVPGGFYTLPVEPREEI